MTAASYFMQCAPEWILLGGALTLLLLGVTPLAAQPSRLSTVALLFILLALGVTCLMKAPDGTFAAVGLWTTSLTHYVRCIALGMGMLILLVNWNQPVARECGEYLSMLLFSLLGVLLTASANDLIVLFLAIELVSVPTYILIALSREDNHAAESAVKYFFLGALAAAILAYGLSFLYGGSGSTTMFHVDGGRAASALASGNYVAGYALTGLLLVLGGLAFKVAAVPFHAYLADVYEGAASPVAGMLGFVPKFAGFVALIKVFSALNWYLPDSVSWLIWVMAVATMTTGNVLALLQKNVKRMLAYSSIAHTGYMLIALLVGPSAGQGPMHDGVAALLFYVAVYGAMNLGAFALLSAFQNGDRPLLVLDDLKGLATQAPWAALGFAVCVFSLMGFPPTAGFLGKVYVFASVFSIGADHPFRTPLVALAVIGVINSAIGAAYYLRLVSAPYWDHDASIGLRRAGGHPVRWGLGLCAVPLILLFAVPRLLWNESSLATDELRRFNLGNPTKLTDNSPVIPETFLSQPGSESNQVQAPHP